MDLVTFLRERLDEDEAVARESERAHPSPWRWGNTALGQRTPYALHDARTGWVLGCSPGGVPSIIPADHIARHDPARVLREVAAKRSVLDMFLRADALDPETQVWLEVVRHLAAVYADHPDYDKEWTP